MNEPQHIVAFTGHRTYDHTADEALCKIVATLYSQGCRIFRSGMAEGFDLAAAEAVIQLKEHNSDIKLELYIPWPRFAERFSAQDQARYQAILNHADIVRYTASDYHPAVFHRRNDMLVEGAGHIVAWWDGSQSGTRYTVSRARRSGSIIYNLYPDPQLNLML